VCEIEVRGHCALCATMVFESDSDRNNENGILAIEKNVNNEVSDAPNGIVKDWDAEEGPLRRK
jgi:hypothetical protein